MRILLFLPELGGGGAQRTLINLANEFGPAHEVALVAASARGPARPWIGPAVALTDLGCPRVRWAVRPLARVMRSRRPDVVLASGIDANIAAWLARAIAGAARPKLVLRETNSHRARELGRAQRLLAGLAYRRADGVVALSSGVRDELIGLYDLAPGRVVTVHNPVAVADIAQSAAAARSGPPPWPKTGPTVIGIGRLTRQKGFERLLAAVAALPGSATQLVILGEGEQREELAALARRNGLGDRLVLPGFVERPERWLAHADVFALPSRWEGFGHVIVEAMAAGVPVVAFDCPYGPRDIVRDGDNGLLVAEGDVAGLTAALRRVLEQPALAERLRTGASAGVVRYAQASIARSYLALFEQLTAGTSPASPPSV